MNFLKKNLRLTEKRAGAERVNIAIFSMVEP